MQQESLHFIPSRVEGLSSVREAAVFPDRLEFLTDDGWVVFPLEDLAQWPRPRILRRLLSRYWRPSWLPVGERNWFNAPSERFFRFYSSPRIVVYMPDEQGVEYHETIFRRIQEVLRLGGFATKDLG